MAAPGQTQSGPFLKGSIIWEKKGPLPVWAWALIALGLVLAWAWWSRSRTAVAVEEAQPGPVLRAQPDQGAPPIFIVPPVTVGPAPPGGGAPGPPGAGDTLYINLGPSLGTRPSTGRERDLYDWIKDVGKPTYGIADLNALRSLNPNLDKALTWRSTSTGAKSPVFKAPIVVRVR